MCGDLAELKAGSLYRSAGWRLPQSIGRIYDGGRMTRELGFVYRTGFGDVRDALREGRHALIGHDPACGSPILGASAPEAIPR